MNNIDFDPIEMAQYCKDLRIPAFKKAIDELRKNPEASSLSPVEWIMKGLREENSSRKEKSLKRRIKDANLKYSNAVYTNIIYNPERKLNKGQIASLITCDWLRSSQNCLITGKSGAGKSWLASALGNAACCAGFKVKWVRFPFLLEQFKGDIRSGASYYATIRYYTKYDLLIIDDWGYGQIDAQMRTALMELFEKREGSKSTLMTTVLPIKDWAAYLNDPTFSNAITDRFLGKVIRIEISGRSLRTGVA